MKTECNWWQEGECDFWGSGCGGAWQLIDGTPSENGMKFCPYCGKKLVEHPFEEGSNETGETA